MWNHIVASISAGEIGKAKIYIEEEKMNEKALDDTFYILEATVCQAMEDEKGMHRAITNGLKINNKNYELYYLLAAYYMNKNIDQAYLCLENAIYYCQNSDDTVMLREQLKLLKDTGQVCVVPTAIVIVAYNLKQMQIRNIESIRNTLPKHSYQIIVVDNASEDGIAEWLSRQEDITLVRNTENRGFSVACNQGVHKAREIGSISEDIFILNNDTQLCDNSLFWLRMGLYENPHVGAVGSVSNYAGNGQQLELEFDSLGDYLRFGKKNNVPLEKPYEERVRLSGFAMLVKGSVWDSIGGMDEGFAPGYFEDDALCMEIIRRGFRVSVCKNSFIYHAGSQSFSKKEGIDELLLSHHQLFIQKYGFDILRFAKTNMDLIYELIEQVRPGDCILQLNAGLGADVKLLDSLADQIRVFGLEKNMAIRAVIQADGRFFADISKLKEKIKNQKIDILIATAEDLSGLTIEERTQLAGLCKPDCKILPGANPYRDFPFDRIKLVIWDMDDTFWNGTISEEEVNIPSEHVRLIETLTSIGIVNSISSKNDEEPVLSVLRQYGIDEFFVFNQINWGNKGNQIQKKLKDMGLRSENTLFIDDSIRNLQEAKHFCPDIMTATPDIVPHLMRYANAKSATDCDFKRLHQYKLLERKSVEKQKYDTNEQFLLDSQITISIQHNCLQEIDRIAELVLRTNQLNYTKNRCDKKELIRQISDDWMDAAYIILSDKFGDYGIVGFYCFNRREKRMEHFLFSCRVLGMRLEQYIYQKIGSPRFDIQGTVASELGGYENISWIKEKNQTVDERTVANDNRIKILLKGPCDLSAVEPYLIGGKVTTEFNYVSEKGVVVAGQNHSMNIWESAHLDQEEINKIVASVPFIDEGDFQTLLFSKQYHVICYSLLPDCHAGLYRKKSTGQYISFGSVNFDLTSLDTWDAYCSGVLPDHGFHFSKEVLETFSKEWEYVGTTEIEDIIRNLNYIYENVPGNPIFVLLLGSEMECDTKNAEFANHAERHQQVNAAISTFAKDKARIKLIRMTELIHTQEDYDGCINHFCRRVYYDLATEIVKCINESF